MGQDSFNTLFEDARQHDVYWTEWVISDFTEELARRMHELGLTRGTLAKKLGSSPAYVTKILRGDVNFTLKSMVKLARAVGTVLRIHLAPVGAYTRWVDTVEGAASEDILPSASHSARVAFEDRVASRLLPGTISVGSDSGFARSSAA